MLSSVAPSAAVLQDAVDFPHGQTCAEVPHVKYQEPCCPTTELVKSLLRLSKFRLVFALLKLRIFGKRDQKPDKLWAFVRDGGFAQCRAAHFKYEDGRKRHVGYYS